MAKSKTKKEKQLKKKSAGQKGVIIGLSVALALAGGAAVAAPLIVMSQKKDGGEVVTTANVHFETDGGTQLPDQKVVIGESISEPAVKKDNSIVEGWYSNSALTDKVTFPLKITGNITLYVKWSAEPTPSTYFTVKFNSNGGTSLADQQIINGGKVNEPVVGKTGSTLEGWYTEATFINKVSFPYAVTKNVTLYAKWSIVPVTEYKTVTFNGNGKITFASGSETAQAQIQKGAQIGTIVYPQIVTTQDGWAFDNWCYDAAGNQPVSATDQINEDKIIYARCVEKNQNVTISFTAGTGASLIGQSSIEVAKATTWKSIKENLPSASKDGYTFEGWLLNGEEPDDDTKFEANATLTANFEEIEMCTVEVVLVEGQELSQGSLEIEVEYGTKWKEFSKPTIIEGNKIFSGWYQDEALSQQWQDDDEIDNNCQVYAKFVSPNTCPTITFADPEDGSTYTWVGSQVVKADTSTILWDNVAKPGVYKDATGTWATGYTSDSYFTKWSTSKTSYVAVPSRITTSIIVYPMFADKTVLKLKYYDDKTEQQEKEIKADPNSTWSSLALPTAYPEVSTKYFMGWQATMKSSGETKILEPSDYVRDIQDTVTIEAYCSDQVNLIEFQTTGVEKPGEEGETEIQDITLEGNPTVGVDKTQDVYLKNVNKPIAKKDNYSFLRWQIYDNSSAEWVEITDETVIAASEEQTTTLVRPVVESTFTITFNAMGGTIVDPRGTVTTDAHTSFGNMYKPDITAPENKVFLYWAIKNDDDTYTKISDNYCFSEATEVYAIYDDDIISSIVNFKLTTADLADTDYPCTISGIQSCVNHKPGEKQYFKNISKATATKSLHYLEGWYLDEALENPVSDDYELPEGNEQLTVYAKFAWTTTYEKVTVAEPEGSEYEILNENKMFVQTGAYWKNISNNFSIQVKKVGYEVDSWKDQNGETVDDNYQFNTTTTLTPVWKESKKQVTVDLEGDTTISGVTNGKVIEVPYYDYIKSYLSTISPSKEKNTFIGWKIKNADNTYTDIDDTTVVTSDLTIVPKFRGESEFLNGNQPYYYDKTAGKWAAILDCSGIQMEVRYAGDTASSYVDKYTFNEEVFLGKQMTSIPDYFMYGCSNWNNGYTASEGIAKPFTIPSTMYDAYGYTNIGNFVFAGCSSFTQKLIFETPVSEYPELYIGESFMDQCYKWNNDLDLTGFQYICFGPCFMHDCKSWIGTLTCTGWIGWDGDNKLCFATSDKYCPLAVSGFKIKTTSMSYDNFKTNFPLSTVAPYRTHSEAQ